MPDTLPSFELTKNVSYGEQIREKMRELLSSGQFPSGEKLPSVRKLAATLGTNRGTVHIALKALEKEGLLSSSPRRGIFAQKRDEKLICVGVFGDCGMTKAKSSPYAQAVREALREELQAAGIEMDLWIDSRPMDQHGKPWARLIKAAEQRQFQAFISTETNPDLERWQQKLPVPVSFLGAATSIPNNVDNDLRQFVEIGLRELVRQGCRSVGLIAPVLDVPDACDPKGFQILSIGMLSHFTDVAAELGLTVKNEWMRVLRDILPENNNQQGHEHFGYEQFLKLWSQPEKPEGLLVFSDTVARGTILALRDKQVRVPDELKLVLHKNETIDLVCPMPATFVIASEREMARALISQVQKQFRGEACERISLPFKLTAHNNPK